MATQRYVVADGPPHYVVTVHQLIKKLYLATIEEVEKQTRYYNNLGMTVSVNVEHDTVVADPRLLEDRKPLTKSK